MKTTVLSGSHSRYFLGGHHEIKCRGAVIDAGFSGTDSLSHQPIHGCIVYFTHQNWRGDFNDAALMAIFQEN